ncbi:MAG: transcription initiation protein [Dyadobacter sp.]|uniref:YciI family protein n=1 Tax=Dyadobacter sp. TaxID=1914288 RepID=UPI001B12E357|nr:YciI family protein [Dyadobacter sp.]MBO9613508.1 transcription initiation protein [Dyadobacter sp.]
MKDFMFVFRNDPAVMAGMSPEVLQTSMQKWMDWIGGIAAQGKLVDRGSRLADEGNVVRSARMVTDGPYIETKESIGGFIMVRTESLAEATEIAKGCPILSAGGNVEVRPIVRV